MRILIILSLLLLSSGCTTYGTVKEGVKVEGAKAADEADRVAVWQICKAGSRGALIRGWMQDQETFDLWIKLCIERTNIDPQLPTE